MPKLLTADEFFPKGKSRKLTSRSLCLFLQKVSESKVKFTHLLCCLRGNTSKISPVATSDFEDRKKGWLSHVSVPVNCSSAWIGIPDVRFDNASSPITNIDPGGGKFPSSLFKGLDEIKKDVTCLTFIFKDGDHVIDEWEGVFFHKQLFIEIPCKSLPPGIKEGFVLLLDYAEEVLQAANITLVIPKDIIDRATVLRAFTFIGFNVTNPQAVRYFDNTQEHLFMNMVFN